MTQKTLFKIFTRDYSAFTGDLVYWLVTDSLRNAFGVGFSIQLARYTGRTMEIYRPREDFEAIKNRVLDLPLSHALFSDEVIDDFLAKAKKMDVLVRQPFVDLDVKPNPLQQAIQVMEQYFSQFFVAMFLSSDWAEEFRKKHGQKAEPIIKRYYECRLASEGHFERFDDLARLYISAMLEKFKLPKELAHLVRFLEFMDMLFSSKKPKIEEIKKRRDGYILAGGDVFVGKTIEEVAKKQGFLLEDSGDTNTVKELRGTVAYKGKAVKGTVQTVFNAAEVKKFQKGNILVAPQTDPDFLPAIKKARAIIIDEGGVLSHAAIVAREFKIPCVIGTKIATEVLKDGDRVEVDATKGIVRKL
ncbi:MAG: PEP-utilizing enzyme [bacterium]|nr:PEP-utilizing enzyme [bacterium]